MRLHVALFFIFSPLIGFSQNLLWSKTPDIIPSRKSGVFSLASDSSGNVYSLERRAHNGSFVVDSNNDGHEVADSLYITKYSPEGKLISCKYSDINALIKIFKDFRADTIGKSGVRMTCYSQDYIFKDLFKGLGRDTVILIFGKPDKENIYPAGKGMPMHTNLMYLSGSKVEVQGRGDCLIESDYIILTIVNNRVCEEEDDNEVEVKLTHGSY